MPSVDPWIGPRGSAATRLLQILRAHGPMTRPEAARLTGMSVGGIRPLASALLAAGQITEEPLAAPRGRGRPGRLLTAVAPRGTVLGLDFGHNHVAAAVAELDGAPVARERRAADVDHDAVAALGIAADLAVAALVAGGTGGATDQLARTGTGGATDRRARTGAGGTAPAADAGAADRATRTGPGGPAPAADAGAAGSARAADAGAARGQLSAVQRVVVGLPGPVDTDGRLRSSTIAGSWADWPVAAEIAARLALPDDAVDVENDAHLGALGEARAGAGAGCADLVYVKASHGLGAGLILGGELYRGAAGLTGELGHAVVDPDGALCRCGNRGCLETVVSVERVREQVRFVLRADDPDPLPAAAGHAAARRIVLDAGRALGRALADVCNLLNPQLIVLGGELAAAGPPLVDGVTESIRRYAQPAVADTAVRLAHLGEQAQTTGALALAAQRARDHLWAHAGL